MREASGSRECAPDGDGVCVIMRAAGDGFRKGSIRPTGCRLSASFRSGQRIFSTRDL